MTPNSEKINLKLPVTLLPAKMEEREEQDEIPMFHFYRDGLNGTVSSEDFVPCFLAGTKIRTPAGDIAIENLKIGDKISTINGTPVEIKWIGRRNYRPPLPENDDIIPVLIKKSALQSDVPDDDLCVSPHHGIKLENFIIPAGALINEATIFQNKDILKIEYYHIHTSKHEIIVANNTPAETFIDSDSLRLFENADEFYSLYPEASMNTEFFTLPRLDSGFALEQIRGRLSLRSGLVPNKWTNTSVIGYLDYADRQEISGWAYCPNRPHESLRIELLNRGNILAKTIANIYRPDVKRSGFGSGRCGFNFLLPAPLPSLQRHELSVRVSGMNELLQGSPVILDPGIAQELIKTGSLERLLEGAASGARSKREVETLVDTLMSAARKLTAIGDQTFPPSQQKNRRSSKKGPIVLFLDTQWPTPINDAGSNAIISHIIAFKELGFEVKFCATSGSPKSSFEIKGCAFLEELGVNCVNKDGLVPEAIIGGYGQFNIEIVYLHRLASACSYLGLVRNHIPKARIIYSLADLHHIRLSRQAILEDSPALAFRAKSVRAAEFCYMQMANCVFTHSAEEFNLIRNTLPHVNVHCVKWGVEVRTPFSKVKSTKNIGFIGSANHAPNFDAVHHFCKDILPLVWKYQPDISCLVVGSDWPAHQVEKFDPRIQFLGHQGKLDEFFSRIDITTAPMRFGAGIKGKIVESMAHGCPCVMSSISAEGLDLDETLSNLVGDSTYQASTILKLLDQKKLYRAAQTSGLKLIQRDFSQTMVTNAISRALNEENI